MRLLQVSELMSELVSGLVPVPGLVPMEAKGKTKV
jgi:hypothetical protein